MNSIWETIVEKGRLALWLILGGGILLSIVGGLDGFLDGDAIEKIFLAMLAAALAISKTTGE